MVCSLGTPSTFRHFALDETSQLPTQERRKNSLEGGSGAPFIFLKASLCGRYLAVISALTVSIFSADLRRVPLARLARPESTRIYGEHAGGVWSVDGSTLYVRTTLGRTICVYRFGKRTGKDTPVRVVGVGNEEELPTPFDEEDEGEEESEPEDSTGRFHGIAGSGCGVRTAKRGWMSLYESRHQHVKPIRELRFVAVLNLPTPIVDMSLSLESIAFACLGRPTIFTMSQPALHSIHAIIELADFVTQDDISFCQDPPEEYTKYIDSKTMVPNKLYSHSKHLLFVKHGVADSLQEYFRCLKSHSVDERNQTNVSSNGPFHPSVLSLRKCHSIEFNRISVRQIDLNESLDMLAVVLSTGAAALFAWKQPFCVVAGASLGGVTPADNLSKNSPLSRPFQSCADFEGAGAKHAADSHAVGIVLRWSGVQLVKLNRPRRVIAIALSSGFIDLVSLHGLFDQKRRIRKIHPCDSLGLSISLKSLGQLTCMRWSSDGLMLVVGWSKIGPVIYSHTGVPLFAPFRRADPASPFCRSSSLHRVPDILADSPHRKSTEMDKSLAGILMESPLPLKRRSGATSQLPLNVIRNGILSASWVSADLGLVVCCESQPHLLTEYRCYRNGSIGVAGGLAGAHGMPFGAIQPSQVLIGPTEFLACQGKLWSPGTPSWIKIPLPPPSYTTHNWPMRSAVCSPNGEWLLTAGKWGVAVYGTRLRRWRLFGDVQQERSLHTEALPIGWYSPSVFFLCFRVLSKLGAGVPVASASDAVVSAATEQAFTRKALHKSSVNLMKSAKSLQSCSFGMLFFDVDSKLDTNFSVARIPCLNSRPLKVFLFSSTDTFRPSIGHSLHSSDARISRSFSSTSVGGEPNISSSLYSTVASLLVDPTRPGSSYVDCRANGSAPIPRRNHVVPSNVSPLPLLAVYDIQMQLSAYKLSPPADQTIQGGEAFGSQRVAWEVCFQWRVDLSGTGWIDHPIEMRFVGSDHHLFVQHTNGTVTSLTLSDPRPSISSLLDSRLGQTPSPKERKPRSLVLTSAARDKENWSWKTSVERSSDSPIVEKNFIESGPLLKGVEMMWSTPQCQLPFFCPIPVPTLRPFGVPPTPAPPYNQSSSGVSETFRRGSQCDDKLITSTQPSCQPIAFHSASPLSTSSFISDSPPSLFETTPGAFIQLPRRSAHFPSRSSHREDHIDLSSCTVAQAAQPASDCSRLGSHLAADLPTPPMKQQPRQPSQLPSPSSQQIFPNHQPSPNESPHPFNDLFLSHPPRPDHMGTQSSLQRPAFQWGHEPQDELLEWPTSHNLSLMLQELSQITLKNQLQTPDDFWEDISRKAPGVFIWCDTTDGLSLLTVSLQSTQSSCSSKYMQIQRLGSQVYTGSNARRCAAVSYEGVDFRYRRLELLTCDRRLPSCTIGDVIITAGTATGYFASSLFGSTGPFNSRPYTQLRFEKQSFLHPILSLLLSIEPPDHVTPDLRTISPGIALAARLADVLRGSAEFAQILELLLHQTLEECVPLFNGALKQYNSNPDMARKHFLKAIEEALHATPDLQTQNTSAATLSTSEASQISTQLTDEWERTDNGLHATEALITTEDAKRRIWREISTEETPSLHTSNTGSHQAPDLLYFYCCIAYPVFRRFLRVLTLLKRYPDCIAHIVIAGIRKTEPLLTPALLFPMVGLRPEDLFNRCLLMGKLHDASLHLIVLQHVLGPLEVRRFFVIPLLREALKVNQFRLAKSVVTFFNALYVKKTPGLKPGRNTVQLPAPFAELSETAHVSSKLWSPVAVCSNGVPPPVVAGDADGVDRAAASAAFLEFEQVILKSLLHCIEQAQWIRLLTITMSLNLNLPAWLAVEAPALRRFFGSVDWSDSRPADKGKTELGNDLKSPMTRNARMLFGDLLSSFQIQFRCHDRQVRLHCLAGQEPCVNSPRIRLVSPPWMRASKSSALPAPKQDISLTPKTLSARRRKSLLGVNLSSLRGLRTGSDSGSRNGSWSNSSSPRRLSLTPSLASPVDSDARVQSGSDSDSKSLQDKKSPRCVSRLDSLAASADEFLEFLLLVFVGLEIPSVPAAISLAARDHEALEAVLEWAPGMKQELLKFHHS